MLRGGAMAATGLAELTADLAVPAASQVITGFELIPTRAPMDERVHDAWQRNLFQQGRFQTHYEPAIVRPLAADGQIGIGDADMNPSAARGLIRSLVGTSPWEHFLDDRLGGIL